MNYVGDTHGKVGGEESKKMYEFGMHMTFSIVRTLSYSFTLEKEETIQMHAYIK